MKKTYIQYTDDGTAVPDRFDGCEKFALYIGISQVDGGWLLETGGDPASITSLADVQSDDADSLIGSIQNIISDPVTPWEECSEEDKEYIYETL